MLKGLCLALALVTGSFSCSSVAKDPAKSDDGPNTDESAPGQGRLYGTVWAPGNAPGMVPVGHEIPVHEALVYLSYGPAPAIPQRTYCDQCTPPTDQFVQTDHNGYFQLDAIKAGTYYVVVEKGQFRIEREVTVTPGEFAFELPAEMTTLPSYHRPDQGEWTPRIALASGDFDALEDILGKMGMGNVSPQGKFVAGSGLQAFDVYANGGAIDTDAIGTLTDLVENPSLMSSYHVIIIPCASDLNTAALRNPSVLENIRDFVADGGKLYVTDWSGEWADNVFPAQVELGASEDTPGDAYDSATGTWNTTSFGSADGFNEYDSMAAATDPDMRQWLDGQVGPTIEAAEATFNAGNFGVADSWNVIEDTHSVEVGTDMGGTPVIDNPTVWVDGSTPSGQNPLTVTYEPAGCGRVMYSTYHTTDDTHLGLKPQERVLLYLLLEIGECKAGPIAVE